MKLFRIVFHVSASFFFFSAGIMCWQVRQSVRHVETEAVAAISDTRLRVADTSRNVNAVLIQLGIATDQAAQASIEQRAYFRTVSQRTIAVLEDADKAINQFALTTQHFDTESDATLSDMQAALREMTQTADATNKILADPSIPKSLANIERATKGMAESTEHVASVTGAIDKKVQILVKPASLAKRAAGWAFQVFAGIANWFK